MTEKEKGVAICETCGDVVSVWIKADKGLEPISSEGICACNEPVLRLLGENENERK